MSEDVQIHNNPQNADDERMLTKHDVPKAETEHEKSATKKKLFGDDRQKVDISEVFTVDEGHMTRKATHRMRGN